MVLSFGSPNLNLRTGVLAQYACHLLRAVHDVLFFFGSIRDEDVATLLRTIVRELGRLFQQEIVVPPQ